MARIDLWNGLTGEDYPKLYVDMRTAKSRWCALEIANVKDTRYAQDVGFLLREASKAGFDVVRLVIFRDDGSEAYAPILIPSDI